MRGLGSANREHEVLHATTMVRMARGRMRSSGQRRTHDRGWALLAGDSGTVVARSRSPLIGRRRELQFVGDRLDLARAGRPQGVIITGPTGIGKSRFAREVREHAGLLGFHDAVITSAHGDGIPFAPLTHQLVPLLLESFGADEVYRTDLAVLEDLTSATPTVPDDATLRDLLHQVDETGNESAVTAAETLGDADTEPALWLDDRHHDLVQRLLTLTRLTIEAAQRQPLLLVIDDLQAADPATAIFVDQLLVTADRVARHEEVPLLVVALFRPGPGGSDNADELARLPGCDVLPLNGFDRLESLDLLTALGIDTSLAEVDAVIRASGGSPLFLESVSRVMLSPNPDEAWTTISGIPLPETVLDAVAAGLSELPDASRATLADIALLAEPTTVERVCFLLDLDEDELGDRLAPAIDDGLVEIDARTIRFTHTLRRLAAASTRGDTERAARHLSLAQRLLDTDDADRRPGDTTLVAHHLLESGAHAPDHLVHEHAALAATDCLDAGASLDAGRYFDAAIAAADGDADPSALGQLHLDAARAWVGALDVSRASTHAQRAALLFEQAGDRRRWAEAVLLRFRCVVYRARYRSPLPPGDDLERVQRDDDLPEALRVEALVTASELAWIQADAAAGAGLADEAHERAHAAGLDTLASASLVSRATAAWLGLDLRGASRLLEEAERLAERSDNDVALAVATGRIAFTRWLLGDLPTAEDAARRALTAADDAGRQLERAMPLAVQTAISVARGDRSAAELRADEVILIQRASGDWWTAPFVFGPLAYAAALAGDERELRAHLRALRDSLGGEAGSGIDRVLGMWARAFLGEPRPTDIEGIRGLDHPEVAEAFPEPSVGVDALCAAFVDVIDFLGAGPVPAVLRDRLTRIDGRGQVMASTLPVLLPRVNAAVARLNGDLRAAELAAWDAVEVARTAGLDAELARAHLEVARIATRRGLGSDAERHLDAFLSLCEAHRLHGLLDLAGRLSDIPSKERVAAAGREGSTAPGCPIVAVIDLTSRSWLSDRAGAAQQQVRRQVLQGVAQQVEAFGGYEGASTGSALTAWFPSVRLAVEFAFRAVARARRRGASVGVGIELAAGPVGADEAVAVATGLCQLASADEVLVSERARAAQDRTPGLEFRHHSSGRVDGTEEHLTIMRARLTRTGPG
jgi:hypothetical protein